MLALAYPRNGNYHTVHPSPIFGHQDHLRQFVEFRDVFGFWREVIDTIAGAIRGEQDVTLTCQSIGNIFGNQNPTAAAFMLNLDVGDRVLGSFRD